jgi:hypothetical protein
VHSLEINCAAPMVCPELWFSRSNCFFLIPDVNSTLVVMEYVYNLILLLSDKVKFG